MSSEHTLSTSLAHEDQEVPSKQHGGYLLSKCKGILTTPIALWKIILFFLLVGMSAFLWNNFFPVEEILTVWNTRSNYLPEGYEGDEMLCATWGGQSVCYSDDKYHYYWDGYKWTYPSKDG